MKSNRKNEREWERERQTERKKERTLNWCTKTFEINDYDQNDGKKIVQVNTTITWIIHFGFSDSISLSLSHFFSLTSSFVTSITRWWWWWWYHSGQRVKWAQVFFLSLPFSFFFLHYLLLLWETVDCKRFFTTFSFLVTYWVFL